jgi:hypothetical protein
MIDRNAHGSLKVLPLVLVLALPLLVARATSNAAVQESGSAEPRPSARRTAARAIERRSSTQWLSDVAERIRILEERTERAATAGDNQRGTSNPALGPGRRFR